MCLATGTEIYDQWALEQSKSGKMSIVEASRIAKEWFQKGIAPPSSGANKFKVTTTNEKTEVDLGDRDQQENQLLIGGLLNPKQPEQQKTGNVESKLNMETMINLVVAFMFLNTILSFFKR